MAKTFLPFSGNKPSIAPSQMILADLEKETDGLGAMEYSLDRQSRDSISVSNSNVEEPANPCVLPTQVLRQFQFTFLIRHPRLSIPSAYKMTIPPLSERTGWNKFMPEDAGYKELRVLFDYLRDTGILCHHENHGIKQLLTAVH